MANYRNSNEQNLILKGGISNYMYIWRSENSEKTCDKCASLDGTVYYFEDEIPQKPHPNCRCIIEVIENPNKGSEPCDCLETISEEFKNMLDNLYAMKDIAENLFNELATKLEELPEDLSNKIQSEISFMQIFEQLRNSENALGDLSRNYLDLNESGNTSADKYFHAKAFCQSSQRGGANEIIAKAIGNFREFSQFLIGLILQEQTSIELLDEFKRDLEANEFGRQQGKDYPDINCVILVDPYRPDDLPERY